MAWTYLTIPFSTLEVEYSMLAKYLLIWWSKVLTKWKIPGMIALVEIFTPLVEISDRVMVG